MKYLWLITCFWLIYSCSFKSEEADLILHNGYIHSLDSSNHIHQAIAIKDGRILECGAERAILNKYRSSNTVDLSKKHVFPGLIDAHCHFVGRGLGLNQPDLMGTKSFDEVIDKIKNFNWDSNIQWLEARGWDQNDWEESSFPTNERLNALFPDRPIILTRIDGHAALVNQAALTAATIDSTTEVLGGDVIKQDGVPTGVLIDNAVELVSRVIPDPTPQQLISALKSAQEECFSYGLTTVDDAGLMWNEIDIIDSLHQTGDLKMRIYAMLSDDGANFQRYIESGPTKTDYLNVRSFKFYADGALGSRGACLLQPYNDAEETDQQGFLLNTPEHFQASAELLINSGFQMNTHCIGDSANRLILQIYSDLLKGNNDLRWRIEHAQVIHPDDMSMFQEFTILPSIQPTHATSDMYWAEERLGRNRIKRAYPYQSLLKQSGIVALGTDFPVEQVSPFLTFSSAVWRTDPTGYPEGGFLAEQCLSKKEALLGMTLWAAMSNFEEEEKGTIETGKFADMFVLNFDLLSASQAQVLSAQVQQTYVGGELVYER